MKSVINPVHEKVNSTNSVGLCFDTFINKVMVSTRKNHKIPHYIFNSLSIDMEDSVYKEIGFSPFMGRW